MLYRAEWLCKNAEPMNWDDLRFVLALSEAGSLLRAAKALGVDHTTVGRRVEAAESALGVRLFTRTTQGYVPTADAKRLVAPMRQVEEAVASVERGARAHGGALEGIVRVTSPETFGVTYVAPRLATFARAHRDLTIEILPAGEILDLAKQQAEIAVRMFRSKQENLVVRRVASVGYGLFASHTYLAQHPVRSKDTLDEHPILSASGAKDIETVWLRRLCPKARASFVSPFSLALLGAARASAGVAILPCYLGDAEPELRHLPMPDEPSEAVWLTAHRDLKETPRVRAVLDFLAESMKKDALLLRGALAP